jgi:hypothetical protein
MRPRGYYQQSTEAMLFFRELRYGEVRRIPLPRTRVNMGKKKVQGVAVSEHRSALAL